MRDIEFRGRRKDGGGWAHGDFLRAEYQGKTCCWIVARGGENKSHDVEQDTVGQYTGWTDKDRKRVYEGDIVRWNGRCGATPNLLVEFSERKKGFVMTPAHEGSFPPTEYMEIVGNKWDNPELLRDEADNARVRPP